MKDVLEKEIRAFFSEEAGAKLDFEPDGWVWDRDSNWGFRPEELAERLAHTLAHKCATGASDTADNDLQRPAPTRHATS